MAQKKKAAPKKTPKKPAKKKQKQKKTDNCFITTACVKYYKLDDNCKELTILRNFRDNFVTQRHNGKTLIRGYYSFAPIIVTRLNNDPERVSIYSNIFEEIKRAIEFIQKKKLEKALMIYSSMFKKLKIRYQLN